MNSFLRPFTKQIKRKRFSRIKITIISACILLAPLILSAQNVKEVTPDSIKYLGVVYQKVATKPAYPKVVGYLSFILPLETLSGGQLTPNFSDHTTSIGFPVGVNVLYGDKFGFSYEFTPTVKASGGASKMSNLLFDPGTMFTFDHGFTIIAPGF